MVFIYFKTGSGFNNVGIQLIELASQAISAEDVDAGDSFTMKFVMDFPAIPSVDKSDVKIELFAMDPSIGKETMYINCIDHFVQSNNIPSS